jgi:hypothetical protein
MYLLCSEDLDGGGPWVYGIFSDYEKVIKAAVEHMKDDLGMENSSEFIEEVKDQEYLRDYFWIVLTVDKLMSTGEVVSIHSAIENSRFDETFYDDGPPVLNRIPIKDLNIQEEIAKLREDEKQARIAELKAELEELTK